jgi:hypothetical protein
VRDKAFRDLARNPLAVQAREAGTWKAVSAAMQKAMLAEERQEQL